VADTVENLILDLIEWVGRKQHTYHETLDAWRTSCPRLPVWEDANDRGLVVLRVVNGVSLVRPTLAGLLLLRRHRPGAYDEVRSISDPPLRPVKSDC
jgi:hypothetical protein